MATSIGEFMKGRHGATIGAALLALGVSASYAPASALPGSLDAPAIEAKAAPKPAPRVRHALPAKPVLTVADKVEGILEMADSFTTPAYDYGQISIIAGKSPVAGFERHLNQRPSGEALVAPAAAGGEKLMLSYETLVTVIQARDVAVAKLGQCSDVLLGASETLDAVTEALNKGRGWSRQKVNAVKIAAARALRFEMETPTVKARWDYTVDEDAKPEQKVAFKPSGRPAEPEKPEFAMGYLTPDGALTHLDDVETALAGVNEQLDRALSELNAAHNVAGACAGAAKEVLASAFAIATSPSTDRKAVQKLAVAFEASLEKVGMLQDESAPSARDGDVREVAAPGWGPAR